MPDAKAPTTASVDRLLAVVRSGHLDPGLASLLTELVARGMPIVVAGPDEGARSGLLHAICAAAGSTAPAVVLAAGHDPDLRSTARGFLRAAVEGLPAAATIEASSLEEVFGSLEAPPIGFTADERASIGLVVVLDADGRVAVAHWVRPASRDVHGHVQRLGPAVLAAWDPRLGRWEDFAWGVMPEIAIRLGVRAGDLEHDVQDRVEGIRRALGT
jgi:hypothetical protein